MTSQLPARTHRQECAYLSLLAQAHDRGIESQRLLLLAHSVAINQKRDAVSPRAARPSPSLCCKFTCEFNFSQHFRIIQQSVQQSACQMAP